MTKKSSNVEGLCEGLNPYCPLQCGKSARTKFNQPNFHVGSVWEDQNYTTYPYARTV